jgi:hypothetical protein
MSMETGHMEWLRVIVHGLCGVTFGAAVGFAVWAFDFTALDPVLTVSVPAAVLGVVSAVWGEPFWMSLKDSDWWNPFGW